jgi:type II secretory ATPase GspE/PulE/Tfp pilus assembly ATPase PilB-like protein
MHGELRWEGDALVYHPDPGQHVVLNGVATTAPTRLRPGDILRIEADGPPLEVEVFFREPEARGRSGRSPADRQTPSGPAAEAEGAFGPIADFLMPQPGEAGQPRASQEGGGLELVPTYEWSPPSEESAELLDGESPDTPLMVPSPGPFMLEGVEFSRPAEPLPLAPPQRPRTWPAKLFRLFSVFYDLVLVLSLGGTAWAVYTHDAWAEDGIWISSVLIVGRVVLLAVTTFLRRRGARADSSSAINLLDIPVQTPDKVLLVGERLTARGADPSVDMLDLVDDILVSAAYLAASDTHVDPKENEIRIAMRIDGIMQDVAVLPKEMAPRLANRFRIIAKLDFATAMAAQDGRVEGNIRGRPMNLRLSVFPTAYGPKIVIRLLDSGMTEIPRLAQLGLRPVILNELRPIIHSSHGIILFTGPTGSGKSTLMYAALQEVLDAPVRRNIVTLEDPIERLLPKANQTQVDTRRGLTFAAGLRTILRQDPDVIMVGEIRDSETAEIALRAGQTGHLLMTTLHANSASAVFSRLMDMDIEPFLLASAISGVVSTRLMRKLCVHCRVHARPPESQLARVRPYLPAKPVFYESRGCDACRKTGFVGRITAIELLPMTKEVGEAVMARRSADEIMDAALAHGMTPILQDGLAKVLSGETSLEEMLRVLQ